MRIARAQADLALTELRVDLVDRGRGPQAWSTKHTMQRLEQGGGGERLGDEGLLRQPQPLQGLRRRRDAAHGADLRGHGLGAYQPA